MTVLMVVVAYAAGVLVTLGTVMNTATYRNRKPGDLKGWSCAACAATWPAFWAYVAATTFLAVGSAWVNKPKDPG